MKYVNLVQVDRNSGQLREQLTGLKGELKKLKEGAVKRIEEIAQAMEAAPFACAKRQIVLPAPQLPAQLPFEQASPSMKHDTSQETGIIAQEISSKPKISSCQGSSRDCKVVDCRFVLVPDEPEEPPAMQAGNSTPPAMQAENYDFHANSGQRTSLSGKKDGSYLNGDARAESTDGPVWQGITNWAAAGIQAASATCMFRVPEIDSGSPLPDNRDGFTYTTF